MTSVEEKTFHIECKILPWRIHVYRGMMIIKGRVCVCVCDVMLETVR